MGRSLVHFLLIASLSFAQEVVEPTHHVSRAIPIAVSGQELSAERPGVERSAILQPPVAAPAATGNTWRLLATFPGVVIHDIAFPNANIGYAVGEQGQVWKTTNAGKNWVQQVLNAGANDYFYGVAALTAEKVAISGFYDSSAGAYGIFRWTENGGRTWSTDMSPGPEWLQQVRFVKGQYGIMMPLAASGNSATTAEYTVDGGATLSDWSSAVANPSGAWFDPQFSMLANLHARASGINFCTSLTGGSQWTCRPSVDSIFDGPVFFLNDKVGWVGGGEISPNVEGWIHVTTNGGQTWSGRTLDGPWPIRSLLFLTNKTGWAGGGNVYTNVGGVYFSTDGGKTWSVDVTTNSEMGSCAQHVTLGIHQIWCAGFNYNNGFSSVIYSTQFSTVAQVPEVH
jgi:photosystem II stability/assembly factor-like uncharacterized protein